MISVLRTILAAVCILIIAVCAALIAQKLLGTTRIDLTQHGIYSLADGTRHILGQLNQPVKLKLYYSRTAAMKGPEGIRYYTQYYLYVRDLLEEYVNLSGGRLTLELIDPRPFGEAEDQALAAGLKRFPLQEDESFFFGLVAQTELGKTKSIEFFEPGRQEFVEYDISKLISSVVQRDKKKIGVISTLPIMGMEDMSPYMMQMMQMTGRTPPRPWTIISQLRQEYDVVPIKEEDAGIDKSIDFLMIVHPKSLSEKLLFAIDQYVMKGGKALVFVDPFCYAEQAQAPQDPYAAMQQQNSSDLNALLRAWGVEMEFGSIAADRSLALDIQVSSQPEPLVTFMNLNEDCVNPDEVVTAQLHSVRMLFAGVLRKVAGAEATVAPLLRTTAKGGIWKPKDPFMMRQPNPSLIAREMTRESEPVMLACRISGKLKTNFPNGVAETKPDAAKDAKPADKKAEPKKPEVIKSSSPDASVLVFADVDMLSDMLAYQDTFFGAAQIGDNASVVLNALDYLSGTADLIAIRSRGRFERPFIRVKEIEAEADKATSEQEQALNKKISEYQEKLNKLGATGENIKLVRIAERQKLQEQMRDTRKELRSLQAGKRRQIEDLKFWLQFNNMVWAPATVLLIAIALGLLRFVRAKRYAARRT